MEKILKLNARVLIVYFVIIGAISFITREGGLNFQGREGGVESALEAEVAGQSVEDAQVLSVKKDSKLIADTTQKNGESTAQDSTFEEQNTKEKSVQESVAQPTPASLVGELASHNTSSDCWITYRGHIYDITGYFGSHPGGDVIMAKYCGTDATNAFDTKEMGIPHSQAAHTLLSNFLIE